MSKKKQPTKGEKIMARYFNTRCHSGDIEKAIDRAIRAAVKKERARNVKILTRWQRSAASAGTVIGDHAAECIGACIEEIDQ